MKTYSEAEHPFVNIAVSAHMLGAGTFMVVGSIALTPEVCAAGPLACGVYLYHLPILVGGGAALVYGGYKYTVNETIPSLRW
jgi:hypothetical protein